MFETEIKLDLKIEIKPLHIVPGKSNVAPSLEMLFLRRQGGGGGEENHGLLVRTFDSRTTGHRFDPRPVLHPWIRCFAL